MMVLVGTGARVITPHRGRQTRAPPPGSQERVISRSGTTSNGLFLAQREVPSNLGYSMHRWRRRRLTPGGSGVLRSYRHGVLPYSMPLLDAAEDMGVYYAERLEI
jgi:hypothetical protein